MTAESLLRGLEAATARRAALRVDALVAARAAAIAGAEPGIAVTIAGPTLRLSAPGLLARVFGSRRKTADARLRGVLTGDS